MKKTTAVCIWPLACPRDRLKRVAWREFEAQPAAWRERITWLGFIGKKAQRKIRRHFRLLVRAGDLHWGDNEA